MHENRWWKLIRQSLGNSIPEVWVEIRKILSLNKFKSIFILQKPEHINILSYTENNAYTHFCMFPHDIK